MHRNVGNPFAFGPGNFIRERVQVSPACSTSSAKPFRDAAGSQCTSQIAGGKKHRWLADIPFFPSIFGCFVYLKDLKATSEMSLLSPDIKKIKRKKMVSVIISRISFVWGLFLGLSLPGNLLLLSVQRHTNEGAQK